MKTKYLFGLLFLFVVCSCSDDSPNEYKHGKYFDYYFSKGTGISIGNGSRQGSQYFDSLGIEYSYINITTIITNDSIIPFDLTISFSKEYDYLRSNGLKSKVFLLPRELTSERQHFDNSMSKELKQFLDASVDSLVSLDKRINPNERLVMTFGVLTKVMYREFMPTELMRMELISSNKQFHYSANDSIINLINLSDKPSTTYLAINLVNSFIIPCGQISFSR